MSRFLVALSLGFLLCLAGSSGRADEIKRSLYVLGIHLSGAEGVALEMVGEQPSQKPGAIALIKRNVKDTIDVATVLKLPTAGLLALQADIDKTTFLDMADRLGKLRLELQANAGKLINPGAGAFFIVGVDQAGAERIALGASGFPRDQKPGTGALIQRQLTRMSDATSGVGLSLKTVQAVEDNLNKGDSFANLASQLAKLRLTWQDELAAQPGFGGGVGGGGKVLLSQANNLTANDPKDRVRKDMFSKVHTVALTAGQTVIIDVESGDGSAKPGFFDTWLRLEDPAGQTITDNDDGGNGLNSRIEFTPPANGNYRLVVTSYRAGATGAYTVTVRQK